MSSFGLNAYRLFLLLFAVWGGSGLFQALREHGAWYRDPVGYVTFPNLPGAFNPWPLLTGLVLIALVVSAVTMWRYSGPGRRAGLATQAIAAAILVATFAYFVPQLGVMGSGTLSEAQLIAHSHTWILLNAVRIVIALATAFWGMVLLGHFKSHH